MNLKQPDTWKRHQLATTERMQADVCRYTRPVMNIALVFALAFLATWGPHFAFGEAGNLPLLPVLLAGISGLTVVLCFPAFVLAVGVESYFIRRLRALSTGISEE